MTNGLRGIRGALVSLALLGTVVGCAAQTHPALRTIAGADVLLVPGRVVLVGEIHGTREMPQLFVDLVGQALASGAEVVVGFEMQPSAGIELQRYLASRGGRAARLQIVEARRLFGDGTASKALTDAFETLRMFARRTKRVRAFAFAGTPGGDLGYADAIAAAHASSPTAVLLALMGNAHNRLTKDADDDGPPVGMLLRQRGLDVRSIYLDLEGGSVYGRTTTGSGIYEEPPNTPASSPWVVGPSGSAEYDVTISVGRTHASLPERGVPQQQK